MCRSPRARARSLLLVPLLAAAACLGVPEPARASEPGLRVLRDVPVRTADGARITIDVWNPRTPTRRARPAARPNRTLPLRPVALLVHGGGWHSGDKRQWEQSRWAQRLARRGWLVVNANYRLACDAVGEPTDGAQRRNPMLCGHAMRTSIADVRRALAFTASEARAWGGDTRRIVLFGASAGGQLALLAASDPDRPRGVRAVVAISPPPDLAWVGARPSLPLHASAVRSIGCDLATCANAWRLASPIEHVRRGVTPPTWAFVAGGDPITPLDPVRRYVTRLQSGGIDATLVTTADATDGCHGPIPCAGTALAGSPLDLFAHAQDWLAPRLR